MRQSLCNLTLGKSPEQAYMARIQVNLLGGCHAVRLPGGQEIAFRTRKTRCLLGLLRLCPNGRMTREQLASLLWDPAPEALARSSLHQALKELREVLVEDADLLQTDRFTIGLRSGAFDIDALRFRSLIAAAGADPAALLGASALWQSKLFGSAQPSAPVFGAWLQIEWSHLRSTLTMALTNHLENLIAAASDGP